jgi:hypothetical protein
LLIGLGALLVVVGLLPRITELGIGPAGLNIKMATADEAMQVPGATPEALSRVAHLVCGDRDQAREAVEEALGQRGQYGLLSGQQVTAITVRTVIELLETAEERRWLRGGGDGRAKRTRLSAAEDPAPEILEALKPLRFRERVAYVLRVYLPLPVEKVAKLLDRPVEAVSEDIEVARSRIRPYVSRETEERLDSATRELEGAPIRWDRVRRLARRKRLVAVLGLLVVAAGLTIVIALGVLVGKNAVDDSFNPPLIGGGDSDFPQVRVAGTITRDGVRIRDLSISGPRGALVRLTCRGPECPYARATARVGQDPLRFGGMMREFGVGTVFSITVTQRGRIGKYTRVTVRRGKPPARVDLCVRSQSSQPAPCPNS